MIQPFRSIPRLTPGIDSPLGQAFAVHHLSPNHNSGQLLGPTSFLGNVPRASFLGRMGAQPAIQEELHKLLSCIVPWQAIF